MVEKFQIGKMNSSFALERAGTLILNNYVILASRKNILKLVSLMSQEEGLSYGVWVSISQLFSMVNSRNKTAELK